MSANDEFSAAMTNRSLRTIKTELEFLADAKVITAHQLNAILGHLPLQTSLHDPLRPSIEVPSPTLNHAPSHAPSLPVRKKSTQSTTSATAPTAASAEKASDEKKSGPIPPNTGYYADNAIPPPPAYQPTPLCQAIALYQYNPTDAGDLGLMPNDGVTVHEYMNAEWWKGLNQRTGQEGIFPRSYVRVDEDLAARAPAPPPQQHSASQAGSSGYGNMPLEVSQGGSGPNKGEDMGKKFGKKLGNAAIFGAGATLGGKIVNGIF